MNTVVILGSTGMIGSGVTRYLSNLPFQVIEVNRNAISTYTGNDSRRFDVTRDVLSTFIQEIPPGSVILNFVGVIRHKISEDVEESVANVFKINRDFPRELVDVAEAHHCRVIQIATDCVFSGKEGSYSETSVKDPIDLYGLSKLQGEMSASNLMTLRVSVIGKERTGHIELMDWVLGKNNQEKVNGYTNHYWNGITTLHLAKIICGILETNSFQAGLFHVVPEGQKSKFELISLIADKGGRSDLEIQEFADLTQIDRTLKTQFPEFNSIIWSAAGFSAIPTIDLMLDDYFEWNS